MTLGSFWTLDGLFTLGGLGGIVMGLLMGNLVLPWIYACSPYAKRRRERERDERIAETLFSGPSR